MVALSLQYCGRAVTFIRKSAATLVTRFKDACRAGEVTLPWSPSPGTYHRFTRLVEHGAGGGERGGVLPEPIGGECVAVEDDLFRRAEVRH